MRSAPYLFSFLISLSFIASAETTTPFVANAHPGAGKIVITGDSLAAGWGSVEGGNRPSDCFDQNFHNPVVDFAVPGLTSKRVLSKNPKVIKESPKLIFVSSGGNDGILDYENPNSYPEEQTLTEMEQIFDQLLKTGAVVVYLGLNPPYQGSERLPKISEMARQKGVIVVDGMDGFWLDTTMMFDEFHPNDAGYKIMCTRIVQAVQTSYP